MQEEATQRQSLTQKERLSIERLYASLSRSSHYTLLGIQKDASTKQIRDAYYELSRIWHPDRFLRRDIGTYGPQVEGIFSAFTDAYLTLSDEGERASYDKQLRDTRAHRPSQSEPSAAETDQVAPVDHGESDTISVSTSCREEDSTLTTQSTTESSVKKAKARDAVRKLRASRKAMKDRHRKRMIAQMRKEMRGTSQRAQEHYQNGKRDLEEGRPRKAESALYLAVKLNPKNPLYRTAFEEARRQSSAIRSQEFITAAENAERFGSFQEALYNYRKAVESNCEDARVFYRIGLLIRRVERDEREAMTSFRSAVLKEPDNPEYRIALADMYAAQGLTLNARREYQAVIRSVKNERNSRAQHTEHLNRAREMLRKLKMGLTS